MENFQYEYFKIQLINFKEALDWKPGDFHCEKKL